MNRIKLENIGRAIQEKRDGIGIRAAAKDIGISPATLSRIENGNVPDIDTFKKLCDWLEVDAGEVLGSNGNSSAEESGKMSVHFKKKKTVSADTASALADLILYAQRAYEAQYSEI